MSKSTGVSYIPVAFTRHEGTLENRGDNLIWDHATVPPRPIHLCPNNRYLASVPRRINVQTGLDAYQRAFGDLVRTSLKILPDTIVQERVHFRGHTRSEYRPARRLETIHVDRTQSTSTKRNQHVSSLRSCVQCHLSISHQAFLCD
ncbi:hypothetical protein AVEN_87848-1 [Araneus ventricosus]|uniref:Uncharacterized protein n=1 Tax=Araneus ventricosus TaxID=182803 RepID=A0A4Y2BB42_ARAVE|nr:hypothetical protein AVEN_87848-1 [Araneus ventricosus]